MAITNIKFKRSSSSSSDDAAKVWLNIGFTVNGEFISLPYGIAVDTMKPVNERSKNAEWRSKAKAKNQLLADLLALAEELDDGEARTIEGLQIQLYRTEEFVEDEAEEVVETPHISFSF